MRSIETLAKLYPELTGKQIIELCEKEKIDAQLQKKDEVLKKFQFITTSDITYFEGRVGHDARYSKVSNARINDNVIYADVEIISIDNNLKLSDCKEYGFNIDKYSYQQVDIYSSFYSAFYENFINKTTESEWNRISNFFKDVRDFYHYYKREEFK